MSNILRVVFVIIGTLIGAGFASGQEVYLFFYSYGIKGIIGIFISSIMMGIIIYKTLILVKENDINNYKDLLNLLIKKEEKKIFFNIKNIINIIINMFILITFFIMIAGFGAYFEQEIGINSLIGSSVLAILCFIVFRTNQKGVVKVSEILVPILIVFITIISILNLKDFDINNIKNYFISNKSYNFLLSSIVYCSYNSILLIPVLITLKNYINNKRKVISISVISTIIIVLLSISLFFILTKVDVDISKLEMPAVYVVSRMSKIFVIIYGFIILGSIFTTAVSLGNSFLQNVSKNKKSYTHIAVIMCITSIAISKIGFSNLINFLYPIFGYLGIIQIVRLTFKKDKLKNP
ncbi:MAG: hypothetical protein U0L98_02300 [Clostridia bacterium]|nr:hypothetical protein [Clostridia bacterium]